jgi:Na+-transporting methylmalonyl-CoA/oxaloacetate decarboxylase gamma subunit
MYKNLKRNLPLLGIAFIFLLLIILFLFSKAGSEVENTVNSAEKAALFLEKAGWNTVANSCTEKTVCIPIEFSQLYSDYNRIQKLQGFDLLQYRGKTVTVYTLKVNNHPQSEKADVYANVMVSDGKVIAADLVCYAIDGFLTGLNGEK